jgi:uncharacterized protein (TIGR03083 family)
MIVEERCGVAELVGSLSEEQLATPSLCGEWTVREVAGHLLAAIAAPRRLLLPLLVRNGFRLHRANAALATLMAQRSGAELADGLREHAGSRFKPPLVGFVGQLTDLQVHGQDMRRPLGLPAALRPEPLRLSLDFVVGGRAYGFTPKRLPLGLRFEAADLDWAWGDGPLVRGPAEALLLALTGRRVVLPELTGDGVPELTRRLAA